MIHRHFLLLNGPNLNRLGRRQPDVYGSRTLDMITDELVAHAGDMGVTLTHRQSNHEGDLLDVLHEHADTTDAVIINPAGLTSHGISLRDGLADAALPVGVVHVSNYHARDAPWPRRDIFVPLATVVVAGLGTSGYRVVFDHLHDALFDETS